VCARYLLLKDLPLPGWVRLSLVARALEHGTAGVAKTLEFTEGEPWLWATEFENLHETWRSAEPRLTIDGVEYEDSEAYYKEHKPAAGDWSETANEQRMEVMCTALNAKFAASGEARALLVASHPHRLLSIKRDRFWGFDAELGGKNMLGEPLTQLRKGYVSEYASEVKQISQVNVVGKRRRGEGGGGGAADPYVVAEFQEAVALKKQETAAERALFKQNQTKEKKSTAAFLKEWKLIVEDLHANGDCQFFCVAQQLLLLERIHGGASTLTSHKERKELAMQLRANAVRFMREPENGHLFASFSGAIDGEGNALDGAGDRDFVGYLKRMSCLGEYGDEFTLKALALKLNVSIQVFAWNSTIDKIRITRFSSNPDVHPPIYAEEPNAANVSATQGTVNIFHFVYENNDGGHYNSIMAAKVKRSMHA